MKILRRGLTALFVLILLVAAAAFGWFVFVFDANAYRDDMERAVLRYTGRALRLEGELAVSLFPGPSIETGPASLSSREGFGPDPMLTLTDASVRLQSWPLLWGDVRIEKVRINEPRVRLGTDRTGATAWGDIVERLASITGRGSGVSDEAALGAGFAAIAAQGLVVQDGELSWTDVTSGRGLVLSGIELDAERLRDGDPAGFSLAAQVTDESRPAPYHVAAKGSVSADFDTFDFEVADFEIVIDGGAMGSMLRVERLSGRDLTDSVRIDAQNATAVLTLGESSVEAAAPAVRYRHDGSSVATDTFRLTGPGLDADGTFAIRDIDRIPAASLTLSSTKLDLGALLEGLDVTDRLLGGGSASLDLATYGTDITELAAHLDGKVSIEILDGTLRGIDVERILDAARQAAKAGATTPDAPADEPVTNFDRLEVVLRFADGIGRGDKMSMIASAFHVAGGGLVDLRRALLDLLLEIRMVRPGANDAPEEVVFEPVTVPVRIRGALRDPAVSVDMQALLQSGASARP